MTKLVVASACAVIVLLAGVYALSIFGRSPRPVPLGTVVWAYETGFTVTHVTRRPASPGMTAYDVTVRVFCPYGERYRWTPQVAHVIDNGERAYGAAAATPAHKILGASDTEHMTFVLPDGIEQPALVFDDTLGFDGFVHSMTAGPPEFYERRRFNLRYD